MTAARFALLIVLIAPLLASAAVYKWTDADGKVQYSDSPPPETKSQQVNIKINSIKGPAVVSQFHGSTAAPGKGKVRLYTTTWCGYCKKAKAHLTAKGIPYDDVDVESSAQGRGEYVKLGGHGVPVILVGEQRMDGFDAGRLDAMLGRAGW